MGDTIIVAGWLLLTFGIVADYLRRKKKPAKSTVFLWCIVLVWMVVSATEALGAEGQAWIDMRTKEEFTIGFDDDELHFGVIVAMAMSDDGRTVVSDYGPASDPQVTVVSAEGNVLARWGRMGDGPGELTGASVLATGGDTVVAAGLRMGIYTWEGAELRRWTPGGSHVKVALAGGNVFAWRMTPDVSHGGMFAMVLSGPDGVPLGRKRRGDDFMRFLDPFRPGPLLASVSSDRVVAGYGDRYVLHVVAGESGDTLSTIARDVGVRSPTKRFLADLRRYSADPSGAPEKWSTLVRRSDPPFEIANGIESFSLIANVFWGPPGVLWVERGLGVEDEYSAPLDRPNENRLWDLFDVGSEAIFLGVASLPEDFRPLAGNDSLLAGIVRDDVMRHAMRVLRVEVADLW